MARRNRSSRTVASRDGKLDELLATPEGTWRAARILASQSLGSWGPAIRALIPKFFEVRDGIKLGLPTMAVDKHYRVYVNNGFTNFMVKLADEVSPENPCATCGATSHHRLAYVAGVICHEMQHPVRKHHARAKEVLADPKLWNVAADLEINDDTLETFRAAFAEFKKENLGYPQLCFPPGVLMPADFREQYATEILQREVFQDNQVCESYYYDLLDLRDALKSNDQGSTDDQGQGQGQGQSQQGQQGQGQGQSQQGQGQGQPGQGQGQGPGQPGPEGQGQGQGQPGPEGQGQGQGPPGPGQGQAPQAPKNLDEMTDQEIEDTFFRNPGAGNLFDNNGQDCGSGAHGQAKEYEDGDPDGTTAGVSEAEGEAISREVAKNLKQENATRGNVPAGMMIWAEEVLKPPAHNWRQELKRKCRKAIARSYGHQRRSWHRFGRASAGTNYRYLFPATYNPVPLVGIVLDTSGSMGSGKQGSALHDAFSEVEGVCKATNARLKFLSVDASAGKITEISSFQEAVRKGALQGGGGTDMRVGIEAMEESSVVPDVCIVLTDGETPWPDAKPRSGMTVIAALVGSRTEYIRNKVPSWMVTVEIPHEK